MLFVADEIFFGDLSLLIQAGIYISKDPYLIVSQIYNRIGSRYYFPALNKPRLRFFLGVHLKSHKSVADYLAMELGFTM